MRMTWFSLSAMLIGLVACGQAGEQQPVENETNQVTPETPTPMAANEAANVSLPDDRTPLEEPKGPIDPKSAEAAGQVVQHYGALIEQGRWSEANAYWGDATTANAFRDELSGYSEVHMEIRKPGDSEGAAGSIYITDPVVFYGKRKSGADFRRAADVILRRVNDVPGSTEAQRRWHIERIEWK
jgi:hypothetical protein